MTDLPALLQQVGALHPRLCPRQVLGVRIGLYGGELLRLSLPSEDKRLLTFVETDGCFADGVSVATGCWVGRRTLRVLDFGKTAAVFVDVQSERTVRVWPHPLARKRAVDLVVDAPSAWDAYLEGYAALPNDELFLSKTVQLVTSIDAIVGEPGVRAECARCGEEILNRREVHVGGQALCASCAGAAYYVGEVMSRQGVSRAN